MMIQAVLGNPHHPEYGVATIPLPIPRDQYAHCMELLEALEIGDAVKADCKVEKVDSFYTVLKRTEMLTVNVEELNYFAKRLDSFDTGEAAQFQAMAHKLELFELKDLINLTFCCQQATVITDFSDLAAVGRDHYMNLHGGSASVDELNKLDVEETARQLIENGGGTITPYGVVYDNGMKLEQVYDGRFFPCYYYEPNAITVAVTSKAEPEDTEHITWLFLPMVQEEIDRALLRGGITDPADVRLRLEDSQLPNEVDVLLDMEYETLSDLNELAEATDGLSKADMEKLGAVVMLAEPKSAAQIKNLAESLDLFDFAPGAHSPAEYGKYMIRQSGHFDYDENLDAFYDYAENGFMEELDGLSDDVFEMLDFGKIGKALRTGENGTFTRSGYVVKHSELVTAPPCAKELPEKPEYLFRLTLGLHPDLEDDRTVTLELPASAEALREVQKQLGTDGWEGAMVLDYEGIIPQAAEFADLPMELDAFNDFAEAVEAMPSREKQIPKLKALLEHYEVTDLATAAGLAEHIGYYILTPEISSPQEAAIDELNFTMDAHSAELLLPHVNLFTYGNEIIKDDNAALTSYGLLHREDYQPMQTPVQETQEQAMTME